ncbi:MAG: hypothetical protein JSR99_02635 [Proteobacteria bacterium]|nr:hypothetical protein [Pseudomonadota bacterium]
MLGKILISGVAAGALVISAGAAVAKVKKKSTMKAPHIYSQVECTGMKSMHWDDATHTCQKNQKK